jgi:hypothetical protein
MSGRERVSIYTREDFMNDKAGILAWTWLSGPCTFTVGNERNFKFSTVHLLSFHFLQMHLSGPSNMLSWAHASIKGKTCPIQGWLPVEGGR